MSVELFHGDCFEYLQKIPDNSIDLILTDPPYGVTACAWDEKPDLSRFFQEVWRVLQPKGACVVFGSEPFSSEVRLANRQFYRYDWIWDKKRGSNFQNARHQPMKSHENILVFSQRQSTYNPIYWFGKPYKMGGGERRRKIEGLSEKGTVASYRSETESKDGRRFPLSIIRFSRDASRIHPTQKPVALLEYLIKTYSHPGETVLDPFMGSGSTGVACVQTGRKFIGCELDPHFFEVSKRRISEAPRPPEHGEVVLVKPNDAQGYLTFGEAEGEA